MWKQQCVNQSFIVILLYQQNEIVSPGSITEDTINNTQYVNITI